MDARISSGDPGLDQVLGGGLPPNAINLLMGLPGTGKTMLCQQFIFAGTSEERPAIYLSTVSEPFDKIVRYAQTLAFFDRDAIGRSLYYEDLGSVLTEGGGMAAVTERVGALIRERRPGMIAIDSFKALRAFADDGREFRSFLHELAAILTAFPATCFWLGEYGEEEARTAPEFAVADAIISLATQRVNERAVRLLEVTKLRGSDFRSGRHSYRISEDGITVFPRLADPVSEEGYRLSGGASPPASHRSTRCSTPDTSRAAPRSSPARRAPARR